MPDVAEFCVCTYSHLFHLSILMQANAVCDKTFSRSEKLSPEILPEFWQQENFGIRRILAAGGSAAAFDVRVEKFPPIRPLP